MAECVTCGHSDPPSCPTCGGHNGYGQLLPACDTCIARGNVPATDPIPLPPPIGPTTPPTQTVQQFKGKDVSKAE